MGYAELVPAEDTCKSIKNTYYMPMHGVMKETNTSTKLHVIFDASAKTTTRVSLNNVLLPGLMLYSL